MIDTKSKQNSKIKKQMNRFILKDDFVFSFKSHWYFSKESHLQQYEVGPGNVLATIMQ